MVANSYECPKFHSFMCWNFSFIGRRYLDDEANVSEIAWKYTGNIWNSIPHKIILDKSCLPKWHLLLDFLREESSKGLLSKGRVSIHGSQEVQKQLTPSVWVCFGCMCAAFHSLLCHHSGLSRLSPDSAEVLEGPGSFFLEACSN